MNEQLQKAINLARKTGDKLIIVDSQRPNSAFVVMSLDDYEQILGAKNEVKNLTENELLDRINRDIALWKNEQYLKEERTLKAKDFMADTNNKANIRESKYMESNTPREHDYFGVAPDFFVDSEKKPDAPKKQWKIPEERKIGAEEVIEEDRQYLEEITY
jgi:hypothetical protein